MDPTMNGNATNKIGLAADLPSTDHSGEEAQGVHLNRRVSQTSNVDPDMAQLLHWQESYRDLWKVKLAFEKKYNR